MSFPRKASLFPLTVIVLSLSVPLLWCDPCVMGSLHHLWNFRGMGNRHKRPWNLMSSISIHATGRLTVSKGVKGERAQFLTLSSPIWNKFQISTQHVSLKRFVKKVTMLLIVGYNVISNASVKVKELLQVSLALRNLCSTVIVLCQNVTGWNTRNRLIKPNVGEDVE